MISSITNAVSKCLFMLEGDGHIVDADGNFITE
jgi:hypothetical protein